MTGLLIYINTNVVQRGEIHILHFFLGGCCCTGSVSALHIEHFECQDIPNLDRIQTKQCELTDVTVAVD